MLRMVKKLSCFIDQSLLQYSAADKKRGKNCKNGGYAAFTVVAVPWFGTETWYILHSALAKFQARIFLFKYLPKETLIHNARLIPIWNKSAEFKLSADSKHCESYFGRKHRNVWFRTLSSKAILVFPAQFLLNQTKRYFKGYAIINLLSLA